MVIDDLGCLPSKAAPNMRVRSKPRLPSKGNHENMMGTNTTPGHSCIIFSWLPSLGSRGLERTLILGAALEARQPRSSITMSHM